ncbi:hypothetical protein CAPTEDRAFT_203554 [Capitella teleta]|uniref:Uncharacterized protein n=1 Tax=Capitella teleta TaxID=283909 RepID=R7UL86_CAPTE|nr:hypothetical protein CAPTEDRAFT_203554 [Capitella teleta]|eukprot:ELU06985.1 hypothetical protein CAPTEDRAFT_203554 [Capitella teleta]
MAFIFLCPLIMVPGKGHRLIEQYAISGTTVHFSLLQMLYKAESIVFRGHKHQQQPTEQSAIHLQISQRQGRCVKCWQQQKHLGEVSKICETYGRDGAWVTSSYADHLSEYLLVWYHYNHLEI